MARPVSDEELQLKKRARRRLVGAIVLVTAVAVILPMVLDSEPRPTSQNVDIQIPSPDSGEFKPKSAAASADSRPLKGMPPAAKGDAATAAAKSEKQTQRTASIAEPGATGSPGAKDSAKREASDATADGAKSAKSASLEPPKADAGQSASESGEFVVQVAALADSARVKQLQKQMTGAGVKTYTEVVATKAGEVTRVRAGPYPTREAAESARSQLKKAGLEGQVVAK
jgi:DedD protein